MDLHPTLQPTLALTLWCALTQNMSTLWLYALHPGYVDSMMLYNPRRHVFPAVTEELLSLYVWFVHLHYLGGWWGRNFHPVIQLSDSMCWWTKSLTRGNKCLICQAWECPWSLAHLSRGNKGGGMYEMKFLYIGVIELKGSETVVNIRIHGSR